MATKAVYDLCYFDQVIFDSSIEEKPIKGFVWLKFRSHQNMLRSKTDQNMLRSKTERMKEE